MEIQLTQHPNVSVIAPRGSLNAITSDQLEDVISKLLSEGVTRLVLDFSQVDYISSAGLRVVLVAVNKCRAAAGKLVVAACTPRVLEAFDITGFRELFPFSPDVESAIELAREV